MTTPREIDKSDQRARRAMWEDFFTRRCPTTRDVIRSAAQALSLRDYAMADLEERLAHAVAECKELQKEREALRREVTRLECGPWVTCPYCKHTAVYTSLEDTCRRCGTEVSGV